MENSRLTSIIHRANLHKKTTSLWYKQVKEDLQNFNISETQVQDRKQFRKMLKEEPQIKFRRGLRHKRSEESKQRQSQRMKEIWAKKKSVKNTPAAATS